MPGAPDAAAPKPGQSGVSTATRSHRAPFTEGPRAWLVLARNAVPVVGLFAFDWPVGLALLTLWFDGVTALGATIHFQSRVFARNDPTFPRPQWLAALFGLAIIGFPYWFVIVIFWAKGFAAGFPASLREAGVVLAFVMVLASNIGEELSRGYGGMTEARIRREFDWQFHMHLARIGAILVVSFLFDARPLIVALAVVLSYVEIYPMRTLRLMGGDVTLDDANRTRSKD